MPFRFSLSPQITPLHWIKPLKRGIVSVFEPLLNYYFVRHFIVITEKGNIILVHSTLMPGKEKKNIKTKLTQKKERNHKTQKQTI